MSTLIYLAHLESVVGKYVLLVTLFYLSRAKNGVLTIKISV